MNLPKEDKEALIKHKTEKAKDTIADVDFLIKNNRLVLAVNRIYYGAFYILSALALKKDFTTSKHQQLIGWFNKAFIKEKLIDRKHGEFLVKAYENRSAGDYDDFAEFDRADILELFDEMKDFYNKILEII